MKRNRLRKSVNMNSKVESDQNNIEGDIENFKEDVSQFTDIDKRIKSLTERIKPLTIEIRELKKNKSEVKNNICTFMDSNNLGKCELIDGTGSIIYRKRRTLIPITQDVILNELKRFFISGYGSDMNAFDKLNSQQKGEKIFDFIYGEREYRFSDVLQNKIKK
jgi:hypothetical protein